MVVVVVTYGLLVETRWTFIGLEPCGDVVLSVWGRRREEEAG